MSIIVCECGYTDDEERKCPKCKASMRSNEKKPEKPIKIKQKKKKERS